MWFVASLFLAFLVGCACTIAYVAWADRAPAPYRAPLPPATRAALHRARRLRRADLSGVNLATGVPHAYDHFEHEASS